MHKSSWLWATAATGLVLLWGSIAIAQSPISPGSLLEKPQQPTSPSVVSPTSGRELEEGSHLSRSVLSPNSQGMPVVTPSQHPADACPTCAAMSYRGGSTVMSSLICDSSGEICIAVGKRESGTAKAVTSAPSPPMRKVPSSAPVAAPSPSPLAAPELQPSKQETAATTPPPLICDASGTVCASASVPPNRGTAAGQPPVPGAATASATAHIQIDGMSVPRESGGSLREDPFNWVVHAYKSQHRLEVYFRGQLYRTYHAVFGRSPEAGAKLWEGDRRTPEGNYLIVGKRRSARFRWFLHINYPNEQDHERFEQGRASHLIPASAHEGGQIGIHGTDSPYLNVADVDWTTGCISVDNSDIGELARLLPVGTLVIIEP